MSRRLVAVLLGILVVASGCSFGQDDGGDGSESTVERAAEEPAGAPMQSKADGLIDTSSDTGNSDDGGGGVAGGSGELLAAGAGQAAAPDLPALPEILPGSAKVIKNISLDIEITKGNFQRQFARASTVAEQFQGFVSASQVSKSDDGELASGTITVRVPSDKFEQAVARIKELGKVTGEDRSGQDVSKQFVDLEARLKHAQTEEAFYVKLMGEAKSVGDMIQVQSQLSGVQLKVEEIQGQLQYLKDQTSYSTLSANIYEPGAATIGEPQPLAKAWQEAVDGFQTVISGTVVGIGWLAPLALIGLIGIAVIRLGRRAKAKPAMKEPEPSV